MGKLAGLGLASSLGALGVASCCVLPMVMILMGLGGSWLAVFAKVAALSYVVLGISSAIIALAWGLAWQRRSLARLRLMLVAGTVMIALAWGVLFNQTAINDFLMTRM